MARALILARRGRFTTSPNPNVGCVIVRQNRIVGEGWHQRAGEAHAEIHALQMAGENAQGATAYVTLEPCSHFGRTPPCCDALIAAGIRRVVVAMQDPNPHVAGRGLYRLRQAGITVQCDVMRQEAENLNRGFLKRMRTGFPFVQIKLGASLDGRTAMASGESQWITSPSSRLDVQRLRAQSAAILSSSATVLADDPALTVRWPMLEQETREARVSVPLRQPVRVIIDNHHRLKPDYRLFSQPGENWLVSHCADNRAWPENTQWLLTASRGVHIDLAALMMQLGRRQINSVWVEAGARLAGALIRAQLVDEMIVYLAPKLLGDEARGLCTLPALRLLQDAPAFHFSDIRQVGPDVRLTLTPR